MNETLVREIKAAIFKLDENLFLYGAILVFIAMIWSLWRLATVNDKVVRKLKEERDKDWSRHFTELAKQNSKLLEKIRKCEESNSQIAASISSVMENLNNLKEKIESSYQELKRQVREVEPDKGFESGSQVFADKK